MKMLYLELKRSTDEMKTVPKSPRGRPLKLESFDAEVCDYINTNLIKSGGEVNRHIVIAAKGIIVAKDRKKRRVNDVLFFYIFSFQSSDILARVLFSRMNKLAKLHENKNLANKIGSTVIHAQICVKVSFWQIKWCKSRIEAALSIFLIWNHNTTPLPMENSTKNVSFSSNYSTKFPRQTSERCETRKAKYKMFSLTWIKVQFAFSIINITQYFWII